MTALTTPFGWLAVQVTVVAGLALLLDALVARRCAAAAARLLAATAALLVLLTLLAFCPVPAWWAWSGQVLAAQMARTTPDTPTAQLMQDGQDRPEEESTPLIRWPRVPDTGRPHTSNSRFPGPGKVVVAGWLGGVACLAGSLAMGLLSLARLRRSGLAVTDADIRDEVTHLSETLGLRRRVELQEAECSGLPATVGWLRPVILLPHDWREWGDLDRRAVLAHELAHIRRLDFLSMLLALACRALHFYHPLARGLSDRLRLRQELAADEMAAALVGGSDVYVRALARLALRADGRLTDGPARLLLSARGGHLVRRIQMLRSKEVVRPLSRWMRRGVVAAFVVVAALSSSLRGPAEAKAPPPVAAEVPPFDLSYICTDETPKVRAVLGVRPSVILEQAGMGPLVKKYTKMLREALEALGRSMPDFDFEDVEQVVADVGVTTQGTGKPNSRSLMLGSSGVMVRMRKDIDWEKLLRALCPDVKVKQQGGVTAFQVKGPLLGPTVVTLHAPDRRTIVMGAGGFDEKTPRVLKPGKPRVLAPGWKHVDRAAIAIAFDNRDGHYGKSFTADVKDAPEMLAVLTQFQAMAAGADFRDGIRGDMHFEAKDAAASQPLLEAVKSAFLWCQREAKKELADGKDHSERERAWFRLVDDVITKGTLSVTGGEVKASCHVKAALIDLFAKPE